MKYQLIKEAINLVEQFELENHSSYQDNINGFKNWVSASLGAKDRQEPYWEGKENGRSPESAISTMIVHMNRYAKYYSKSAIYGSDFSTQEDFIYLINLNAFGAMTKMELIKKNVHDKPAGMQIINRLIRQGWIEQTASPRDKRSKVLQITKEGSRALENQMGDIRKATHIVAGDLSHSEKMDLIRLLSKLENFHHVIYSRSVDTADLLNEAYSEVLKNESGMS